MATDRLINSTQGNSIITELRAMNTNLADIKSAMSGGSNPIAAEKAVNFYDYDGTCRYSYTAAEFAELTAMPDNPTHEGLTAQGWNWSLSDAKTYVASNGKLNVGQMYITSDGKTRLYIRLGEGRLKPYLGLTGNSSGAAVSIDWGDNSAEESITLDNNTVYTPHEYAAAGDYVIAVTVTNGKVIFGGNSTNGSNVFRKSTTPNDSNDKVYQNILTKIEMGDNVSLTNAVCSFANCYSLTSVTIPNGITSIGSEIFKNCYSLISVTIPNTVSSIGQMFLYACYSLTSVILNRTVGCGGFFCTNCYSLTSVTIPSGNNPIIAEKMFNVCYSLTSVTIPDGITSINNTAFYDSRAITSVTIPSSVTSIANSAFSACLGLGYIKFNSSTPPTAGTGAFGSLPTDCIIYVPTGSLSAYTSADNYPSSSTYTYVEY